MRDGAGHSRQEEGRGHQSRWAAAPGPLRRSPAGRRDRVRRRCFPSPSRRTSCGWLAASRRLRQAVAGQALSLPTWPRRLRAHSSPWPAWGLSPKSGTQSFPFFTCSSLRDVGSWQVLHAKWVTFGQSQRQIMQLRRYISLSVTLFLFHAARIILDSMASKGLHG